MPVKSTGYCAVDTPGLMDKQPRYEPSDSGTLCNINGTNISTPDVHFDNKCPRPKIILKYKTD